MSDQDKRKVPVTVTDKADLTNKVMRCLHSLQKLPALVRSFFRAPTVAYAAE